MAQRKLSSVDRDEILRQLHTDRRLGLSAALAEQFGVSRQRIHQLKYPQSQRKQLQDARKKREREIEEKMEEQREKQGGIPYKMLKESPIAVGAYFIEVYRLYHNDGSGTSYLYPSLQRCILKHFRSGEEYRWGTSADYSRELTEKIWDYLHSIYGEQIVAGYYPCESTELIQAATWKWSEQLRKGKEQKEEN